MDNQNLENRIKALEKWQKERQSQQIFYPLDIKSLDILNKYFLRIYQEATIYELNGEGGFTYLTKYLTKQDNQYIDLNKSRFMPYSVDISTDYLTVNQGKSFVDNTILYFTTTDTQPAVINLSLPYYVINSTGQRFQISTTVGGAAVNFADSGTGNQFINYYFEPTEY